MSDDTITTGRLDLLDIRRHVAATSPTAWVLRATAAIPVAIGGFVHLELYTSGGYQDIPVVGPMFLVNIVASALIVLAVLARPSTWVLLAGLALALGSLVGLVAAHTVGIAGFTEASLGGDQVVAILSETAAAVAFVWVLVRGRA